MNRFNLTAISLAAALLLSAPALADHRADSQTRSISIADLDLTNDSGRSTLDARLHAAIKDVCGWADARDLAARAMQRKCMTTAFADAMRQRDVAVAQAKTPNQFAQTVAVSVSR